MSARTALGSSVHLCGHNGCSLVLTFKASTDPDEGWCLTHGTRYVNERSEPLADSIDRSEFNRSKGRTCEDCGKPITNHAAKYCRSCAGRLHGGAVSRRGTPIVLTPSRKPESVLPDKRSRLI